MGRKNLVLTLDETGTPHRWSTWEESICYKVKGLVAWSIGDESVYHGGRSRITGETSTVAVPSIIAVRNKFNLKRRESTLTNKNLFGRDLNRCSYCGEVHVTDHKLTRDHIIPVSRGGQNTWANCTTACKKCNNKKDNKTPEEAGMPLLWVPYTPCRTEALILANRNVLYDQSEFLRAHLPKHSRLL